MSSLKWWHRAVFYQIYPRSFADGNGDGIGDFRGMIDRLDYLQDLGVDALWLSPHFPSPLFDCGYDIADYTGVAPEYGSLEDFKSFLRGAHERGMRVILDLVLNHTSDEHPWFLESKSSRNNPKSDWYIWKDTPPNNWQSCFDGPAWTYVPERDQYYYHYFFKQQPDLNWHNPEVKKAMFDAARFWLDLGVDGFRLDAIGTIFEDQEYPDHPVDMNLAEIRRASELAQTDEEKKAIGKAWEDLFQYQVDQPGVHELMKELRQVLDDYDGDRMLVGEDDKIEYYGSSEDELQLVFNFPLMRTERLTPEWIRSNQAERLQALAAVSPRAWPCNTLGNHDSPRVYNRYGDGIHDAELARLSLAVLLTIKGTPFLYNGEEIGMVDHFLDDIQDFKDQMGIWYYHAAIDELRVPAEEALQRAARLTRDKCRTPMQWSNSPNGGFCSSKVKPWLPVHPNYSKGINVRDQQGNPDSLLNFYRRMLHIRRQNPALVEGEFVPVHEHSVEYLAFIRRAGHQALLVVLNFSKKRLEIDLSDLEFEAGRIVFSSAGRGKSAVQNTVTPIAPFEILILDLNLKPPPSIA